MQDQQFIPPPQPVKPYDQQQMYPMNYQPQNQYPQSYLMYPVQPQQQSEVNVKVEVKSQVAPSAVIPAAIISERKIWTHSHYPTIVYCTQCQQNVNTIVIYTLGAGSWLMVLLLFLFFWPVMCLPCCLTSMQDAVHHCPSCGHVCGRKTFLL
eukprot:TRINITY_DN1337_c0_g1_i2.p1 TRINITY_DN1337_c0_g1~~TRINITY_DN1337_c0_g1_i2.p1  ORF type:complete len:152 (-),score=2.25 TRINITY_DN1337_c0_g1_i2:94-549(-)